MYLRIPDYTLNSHPRNYSEENFIHVQKHLSSEEAFFAKFSLKINEMHRIKISKVNKML